MASTENTAFEEFLNYDFDSDERFQAGIKSILKSKQDPEYETTLERAKWYYYTKFFTRFDWNDYRAWKDSRESTKGTTEEPDASAKKADETTAEAKTEAKSEAESETNTEAAEDTTKDNESETKGDPDVPQRFTFQQIVEMIESGQEIPGIRQIPNRINEGTPSEPKLPARKKPWEK